MSLRNSKKIHLAAILLSATCLTVPAAGFAAGGDCPDPVNGLSTVTTEGGACNMNSERTSLIIEPGGSAINLDWAGVVGTGDALGSIENSGRIDGAEGGIWLNNGTSIGSIINRQPGVINAQEPMFYGGHAIYLDEWSVVGNITNEGAIGAAANGIHVERSDVASIVNERIGRITGGQSAINVDSANVGTIINSGRIRSNDGDAIRFYESRLNDSIYNELGATLEAGNGSAILVESRSVVEGDIVNEGTIYLDNRGNESVAAIRVDDAGVNGDIYNNGNILLSEDARDGDTRGIELRNGARVGGIVNDTRGLIQSNNGAIHVLDHSQVKTGIVNRGNLTTWKNYAAIDIQGSSEVTGGIINEEDGFITSLGYRGINLANATLNDDIVNEGAISSGNSYGIAIEQGGKHYGSIVNGGWIDGAEGGILVRGGLLNGDIVNNDTISSIANGVQIDSATMGGGIINHGAIYGQEHAILIEDMDHSVRIDNYGELVGKLHIEGAELNINEGSVIEGPIYGKNAIVNINTDFGTAANYGMMAGQGLGELNIEAGKTFSALGDNFFVAREFNNSGTLSISPNRVVTHYGNYYQDADATLRIGAGSASNYGRLHVHGVAEFMDKTNIFVDVSEGATFAADSRLANVIAADVLQAETFLVDDNSHLFNFSAEVGNDGVSLVMAGDNNTSIEKSVEKSVNNQGNNPGKGAAKVLDKILIADAPTSGDLVAVRDAFASLGTDAEVSDAVSQTLPTLTGGSTTAVMQTMDTTSQIVQARQDANAGMSSGDGFATSNQMWFKPFGTWSDQGADSGVTGFDARSYGVIGGADGVVGNDWRLGGALAYANTSVESDDARNNLWIDTYQAIFYGSYTVDPSTEVNFQTDVGMNQNDSKRSINFGGLNRTAKGDFNSYSFHLGTGIGRTYELGSKTSLVPSARVDYSIIANDSYTESDAGALNLRVDSQTTDQLIPALQAKLNHELDTDFVLSANAGLGYDLLNGRNSITSSYVGGGASFVTTGLEPSPWLVRTGLGLTYKPDDAYDVSLRYDREDRGEFEAQTGSLKLRLPF